MRDLLLSLVIFGLLPLILWRARYGVLIWAWVSMMIPQFLTYGFARTIPFAQIIAITTLIALPFTKEKHPIPWHPITVLMMSFVVWMSITTLYATGNPDEVFTYWLQILKIVFMLMVTLMLIRGREQIEQLIWVIVVSIGFYGIKGGVWVVLSGGANRVYGPQGGILGNNNEFALGLVMLIPMMYYLFGVSEKRWVKLLLCFGMATCGLAILGSHSRGAFLAIGAMAIVLALKSSRPVLMSILIVFAATIMLSFMPDEWVERMESIQTHEDWSARSRLYTWQMVWRMALDHPIVGAGFAFQSPDMVQRYAGVEMYAWSPHSIYFQALGEHGFVGLALYLALFGYGFVRAGKLARLAKKEGQLEWVGKMMPMVQVSIAGFAVGGAFLSMVYFDYSYYLLGLVVLAEFAVRDCLKQKAAIRQDSGPSRIAAGWSG